MTQILKVTVYLMEIFMELDMKKFSDHKALTFGVQGQKTNLGQFVPKYFGKGLIKPLCPEPQLQFSQTGPHFLRNHEMNPIKL